MKYTSIDPQLFIKNRVKLKDQTGKNALIILQSSELLPRNGDQYFPFRQNSDFFYLTGIDQEKSILCICPYHPKESLKEVLFIMETYERTRIYEGSKLTKEQATEISGIRHVRWISEFDKVLKEMVFTSENIYLNLPENIKFTPDYVYPSEKLAQSIHQKYPAHQIIRLAPVIKRLRVIKEQAEIDLMQYACDITEKTFFRILDFISPGVTENEIEAEMTHEFIRSNATGHAYPPIVAAGKNAVILHYTNNNNMCEDGDLLLMDFGAEYANYAADCSRTIPVNGKFTPRQRACYESVLKVQKMVINEIRPGISIREINDKVNKWLEQEHIKLGLYSEEDAQNQDAEKPFYKKYYPHGTCHYIGLDVHDTGDTNIPLASGMVLTCEPGLYIEEEHIGIRIEDNICVTEEGCINLMKGIPKEPDEIEKLIRNKNLREK